MNIFYMFFFRVQGFRRESTGSTLIAGEALRANILNREEEGQEIAAFNNRLS